jgi:hypothetical protein
MKRYISTPSAEEGPLKRKLYVKPWIFGVAAGAIFVFADAAFPIAPPSAYAFCLSCHARDLVNTVLNAVVHSRFQVTEVAQRALMLTSPGVLIGAFIAARVYGESQPRKADRPVLLAGLGFLMMTIGIVIFGCPTRIVLRAGYGEIYGIVALVGMFAGIGAATLLMRLRWAAGRGGR